VSEVTRIIEAAQAGDSNAADKLLPIVYNELRRLAAHRLNHEPAGQTLDATALVHEVYLRLVDVENPQQWDNRGHFFAAAAEAMRRLLINRARDKKRLKRGGQRQRVDLARLESLLAADDDELLAVDDAIEKLAAEDPTAAQIVKLRFYAGLTMPETAAALGLSLRTAERQWTYARAWLYQQLTGDNSAAER
jgi:RNA polymerase sigma factor (TIGR02999 family)